MSCLAAAGDSVPWRPFALALAYGLIFSILGLLAAEDGPPTGEQKRTTVEPRRAESLETGSDDSSFPAADLEFFEREVRPILANRCYECHSARAKSPKGGLRVDSRQALLAGGDTGPALVPRKPAESLLVDSINYGEIYQMPPKSRLPPAEVAILTKWVERGAPWPKEEPRPIEPSASFDLDARKAMHWCWRPVQLPQLPVVRNTAWPQQDLDRFILAKLEERNLSPAAPTDRRKLLRRVYFDLIGLPPTPEQVAAFLKDESPRAFEKVVDALLKSPHFGETWARHWMDLVRYAETCGHEFDYPIHSAWRYRDYLIRAFNADVPYDQFVLEHLAGDLLPNPRLHPEEGFNESVIGTGFWFLHEAIHAPVDVRGDEAGRIDNQIDVFSKTFLGLTVSCARCHDHKFDAISTKDYYALAGFLRSSRRQEAFLDPGGRIRTIAQQVTDIRDQAEQAWRKQWKEQPVLSAERFRKYLLAARDVVQGEPQPNEAAAATGHRRAIAAVAQKFDLPILALQKWVTALTAAPNAEVESPLQVWQELAVSQRTAPGEAQLAAWRKSRRSRVDHDGRADYQMFADFETGSFDGWFVTGEAFGRSPSRLGQWDSTSAEPRRLEFGAAHSGLLAPRLQGVLRSPTFTLQSPNIYYRLAGQGCEVRLIIDGHTMIEFHQLLFGGTKFPIHTEGKWVWHRQAGDLGMYLGHRAHIEVLDHGDGWAAIDQICFSQRDTPPSSAVSELLREIVEDSKVNSLEALADRLAQEWAGAVRRLDDGQPTRGDVRFWNELSTRGLLQEEMRVAEQALLNWNATFVAAGNQIAELTRELPAPPRVTAITDGTGENEHVFIRGNPRALGEEVPRQLLVSLVGSQPPIQQGSGRLTLARQVADPANPLTARVFVNRVWHHLFGLGIVPTVDNFGVLGEAPTHPELLDFLAQQFVTEGWSPKRLIRSLVLSSSYQMSSAPSSNDEADPLNRLWHRTNIRRLSGEAVRDALLSISGRLDPTLYGPGIPVHITSFLQGRGKPGTSGPLDGAGRRSVYTEVRRNFMPPMLLAFDTPIPFSTVGRRNSSNVPAQALILMNDPLVVEQTQLWAKRLLSSPNPEGFEGRVRDAYLAAISRPPTEAELTEVRAFFESQGREYQSVAKNGSPEASITTNRATEDDPRIWADFCHVLCNFKEFVFLQ